MADPLSETDRLSALERSGLLRMPPGNRLTHVCYVATQLLDCDVSQVNALTNRVQHHVAEWPRVAPRDDVDIELAGCRQIVVTGEVVAVEDTLAHPVMCRLPWSAIWQGYLGVPLLYDGEVIGSLCALTVGPRKWEARDRMTMSSLAGLVVSVLT